MNRLKNCPIGICKSIVKSAEGSFGFSVSENIDFIVTMGTIADINFKFIELPSYRGFQISYLFNQSEGGIFKTIQDWKNVFENKPYRNDLVPI